MRASDLTREHVVSALGDGYVAGCLGPDTLAFRVEAAFRARTIDELRPLVSDLPTISVDWQVRIAPPPDGPGPWTMGRGSACRLVVEADTVSRLHARLRRTPDGALEIRDLGSTNGTWVNGWRVDRATIGPDDDVRLGDVRIVL